MMQPLHTDLEYKDFIESPNVVSMTYCTESGGIATAYCPTTASGWYKTSRILQLHPPHQCPIEAESAATLILTTTIMSAHGFVAGAAVALPSTATAASLTR